MVHWLAGGDPDWASDGQPALVNYYWRQLLPVDLKVWVGMWCIKIHITFAAVSVLLLSLFKPNLTQNHAEKDIRKHKLASSVIKNWTHAARVWWSTSNFAVLLTNGWTEFKRNSMCMPIRLNFLRLPPSLRFYHKSCPSSSIIIGYLYKIISSLRKINHCRSGRDSFTRG